MRRDTPAPVGVLFTNLGSPDDTSVPAVRRYLREFLSDRRVIDLNRALWLPILYGIILTFRPRKSAEGYRSVWMDEGSPLIVYARRQVAGIQARLDAQLSRPVHVALGMRYGNPSIESGLEELHAAGCRKILILPAYPQYSATTVATTFDKVGAVLEHWPEPPALRQINRYHDDPGYIAALANSVREHWAQHGRGDRLVISFHGIPKRYVKQGDPYPRDCGVTAQLLAAELGLSRNQYKVCFQSRFGREPWLQPYLDETMKAWGADPDINTVDVICPGFSADCLETLEEIREENRGYFEQAGGQSLRYIPALNDRDEHIEMFARVIREELAGWV
ncbi:ferrochelatase [Salinisphaera sp. LB1]|uniref:ferrochelatase n=1 Tax=Salinisphaera sp. LB1 TaxID=2183911 RepID=UPI000D708B06|nr:ferrochelatase [Salinisphaera sp. LB1]AWN14330.1 Ferrochelatase, protoheme ferro-lyase [Salinisphaera sp. LB1]